MDIYFAPLEGVTDVIYRRIHHSCFSGVAKYFIPFISPTKEMHLTNREKRSIAPEENAGIPVTPQVLTKYPEHFVEISKMLADLGYDEVNLNMGCPSGTVTAKGKGSGLLKDGVYLQGFLDYIFKNCPIPVSIKTRMGFESPDEWPALCEMLAKYPIKELILHPRTRMEFYKGVPHKDACRIIPAGQDFVYNGNLFTPEDLREIMEMYPGAKAVMLDHGLITNPALAQEMTGGEKITKSALRDFHDKLFAGYSETWPVNAVQGRMHEIMFYMSYCFDDAKKARKAIRKANTTAQYLEAVDRLFDQYDLKEIPGFVDEF